MLITCPDLHAFDQINPETLSSHQQSENKKPYICGMNRLCKFLAVIFAVMLSYLSMHTVIDSRYLDARLQDYRSDNTGSVLSSEKPELLFLTRQLGRFVSTIKNLPVTNVKITAIYFYNNIRLSGFRVQKINPDYLSYPVSIYRNLRNCDIVFPFHYFW